MKHASIFERMILVLVAGLVIVAAALAFISLSFRDQPTLNEFGADAKTLKEAVDKLSADQRAALVRREEKRLVGEPLEHERLLDLSALASLSGDEKRAELLLLEAASRSRRDWSAQVSASRYHFVTGNIKEALVNVDSALRSDPTSGPGIYAGLLALLARGTDSAKVLSELVTVLNSNPPWRGAFMEWLAKEDKNGQAMAQIMSATRRAGGQSHVLELQQFMQGQIEQKNYDRAYFVWLDSLNDTELRKVGLIFDGKFDLQPHNLYFDWTYEPFINGDMRISQKSADVSDRILRLDFSNSERYFYHFQQLTRLLPGKYEMTGSEAADGFTSPGGLTWQIHCVGTDDVLAKSAAFNSSAPWTNFKFEINVPEAGCATQTLRLESATRALLDAKMNGTIYFDNLDIAKSE